ncbi:DUF4817 domain-containing protein [Trichonephila clavipes]|nr:DUF4817 domain-containing protein [Trichonephila clavipes]
MTRPGPSFTPTPLDHEENEGFAKTESAITVQRALRIQFGCHPPNDNNIRRWYPLFETTCCLCKGKSTERPMLSEESLVRVRGFLMRILNKSIRRANRELAMPVMTVWKVLDKRLELRLYHRHLLQALKPTNLIYAPNSQTSLMPTNENFMDYIVFSDESAFNLCEYVDTHNARILSLENPHEVLELPRDSPKC